MVRSCTACFDHGVVVHGFLADFIAAEGFEGSKPGYKFTTGEQGLGYYWEGGDEAKQQSMATEAAKTEETGTEKTESVKEEEAKPKAPAEEATSAPTKEKESTETEKKPVVEEKKGEEPKAEDDEYAELAKLKKKKKKKKKKADGDGA